MVSDTDVGVANEAVLISSNLPAEAYPKVLEEMRIALEYNSSSKCNVFEVVTYIEKQDCFEYNVFLGSYIMKWYFSFRLLCTSQQNPMSFLSYALT